MKRKEDRFSVTSRLNSFVHAFRGLTDMIASERNAWIHALATILALDLAWWLGIDREGFAIIIVAIVIVWMAEAFNTVLEIMANLVAGERYSRSVKRAKDIAAGAVLIAAIGAVCVGVTVLGPHFWGRVGRFFN